MPSGSILVADDDAAIRTVLNQALSRAGYEVRSTGNAATLWRWISQGDGDLVITDVIMPDENAFDLVPRIRKARPDLPVIIMTAYSDLESAVTAFQLNAATVTGRLNTRDSAWLVAETPTHRRDSVRIRVVPPPAQLARRDPQEVLALEDGLARDDPTGGLRDQAEHRQHRDALARPGLTDDPDALPRLHTQRKISDSLHISGRCTEGDVQVLDVEHRGCVSVHADRARSTGEGFARKAQGQGRSVTQVFLLVRNPARRLDR